MFASSPFRPSCLAQAKAFLLTGICVALFAVPTARLFGQAVNVPTWRYDNTHQGQNTQETILTPTNVNTNTFGRLFSQPVDGNVYAQPLYMSNLTINGATHNVVFVATEHDSVYAFDADSNGGSNSAPLWQASMLSTAYGAGAGATTVPTADVQGGTGDIHPEIGITGTPVIDPATQTIFLVSKSKENGNYVQRLHALNILNGSERTGSPVVLTASVPGNGNGSSAGTLTFSSLWQSNRPALSFFNGNIYIAFASHGDDGPFHGWVLVYNETTLQQTAAVCTSPGDYGSGIWSSGAALPIDTVTPNGRMFLVTGNGDLTTYPPLTNTVDYGMSILRYDLSNNGFAISDAFTPFNATTLSGSDLDQGSGGILMLPDQPGPYPHLLLQIGKEGRILILNRDKLNGYAGPNAGSNTNAVQEITGAIKVNQGLWSTPAYWNGYVYLGPNGDTLKAFPLTNGVLATTPSSVTSESYFFPGVTPVVSSNGTQNGIVWALETDEFGTNGPAILKAYNALNLGQILYNSQQNTTRDIPGPAIKFDVPVVTNGKVYVGTANSLGVFGLLNQGQQAAAPSIAPGGNSYTTPQQITMADSTSGATIYYTLNGSTPTTSSTPYTAPFTLSSAATVQAIASATGYLQSAVTSATYSFTSQAATPVFSPTPGSFNVAQSVTMTDTTPNATIYYTTDGSMPTTSSTKYASPVLVSTPTMFNAIAVAGGLTNSNVASATYNVLLPGTSINYASGFANATGLTLNGSATDVDDTRLQLTTGLNAETGTVFYNAPTYIQAFTTDFSFQLSNAVGDGFTFTIQNSGPTKVGGGGDGLGYFNIPSSVAVKFDFFNNAGEGTDSTGLYINGANPTVPAVDMTSSGVLLNSGDTINAHMTYDGVNLALTLTDIVVNKVFNYTWQVNIPSIVGGNTGYIGFTGSSGNEAASQKILSWTLTSQTPSATQTTPPIFSPAAGTYSSAQSVTLSDTTAGSIVYYTTDGSTPTTASAVYKTPITVSSGTVILHAIAQASGQSASSMSSAAYTIQATQPVTATPAFSLPSATYTSAQSVTISDAGATIYYTTNGSTPTTASTVYSAAIPVTATTTIQAIAVAAGSTVSNVATATYVIQSGAPSTINFAGGFTGATGLQLNGNAKLVGANLQLTDNNHNEASSVYWTTPVNVQTFTTNFNFQLTNAYSDGFTFTIQNAGLTALGGAGGSLGYAGIATSVAVKFDIYSNSGEGNDSTGLYINGATPTVPAVSLTSSGITLTSGDTIAAQLVYNGTTLTLNLTDTVTGAAFTQAFTINIPATVGASTAYVGFTGGTGGSSALQNIKSWTYSSTTTPTAAEPGFSPTPGTFTTAQNVMLTSATPGATIYYTVDGSTPTHSSATYSAPIVVNGLSLTIRTFASATGYLDSPINIGNYQIQTTVATPAISPASGTTFATSLSVSITDATANAAIYYTTDGSTPTTSSNKYGAPFSIASSTIVNAIAVASGMTNSSSGTASYTLVPTVVVALPAISPTSGTTFTSTLSVSITDTTANAVIYYTTNGSTPTTASNKYTAPFSITSSSVVNAIAVVAGTTSSSVASASYTLAATVVATPTISPASGASFSSSLSVSITDTTANAVIYYTTDGSTPTTSSNTYSAPFSITSSSVVNAIAVVAGMTNSSVSAASYTLVSAGAGPAINYSAGFTSTAGLTLNGSATNAGGPSLNLTTTGVLSAAGSAFYNTPANIQAFTTDFTFQLLSPHADGFTFVIQNNTPAALGSSGAGLGYGPNVGSTSPKIPNSIALKFDFYNNSGEGADSTGLYVNGATPTIPAVDMTSSGVLLTSGNTMAAHITYDGVNLALTLTDTVLNKVFTQTFPVNIPATIGGNQAYIGFTGSTGGSSATQKILTWTLTSQTGSVTPQTPSPSFSPVAGTYPSAQSVTITDTGATIYYTTDGSTPTTASAVYKAPIAVSSGTVTVHAIAQASGSSVSTVGSAAYTIQAAQSVTATPTFSPVAGTYSSAQSVTISDATAAAVIYYTTNGSAPTTSSAVYSAPIAVSSSTTINALAVATGYTPSAIGAAAYVIQSSSTPGINFPGGFSGAAGLQLNGNAKLNAANLQLTVSGTPSQASSAYFATPVNIQNFTTNFTFQLVKANADGFTFTIQNAGLAALGNAGSGLGYAGIGTSVAVKFDIYSNSGEGADSTGVYINGATPTVPAVDLTSSGITLASGDIIAAQLAYNGTTLTLTLTDTVTNKSFTQSFTVNIPTTVGANTAYVGFTGGTGGSSATQNIQSWTFTSRIHRPFVLTLRLFHRDR